MGLKSDIRQLHEDVAHIEKDLTGLEQTLNVRDLRDHLFAMDMHLRDVINHLGHIRQESELK